jgi:hypothetical protein
MNRNRKQILLTISMMLILCTWGHVAMAATNQADGSNTTNFTLTDSNTVTVTASATAIVKEARSLNGALMANPTLAAGTKFYFVLYVDNNTNAILSDIRIIDSISGFTVDTTTFEILNTTAAPGIQMTAANTASWAASGTGAGTWNGLTWNALTVGQADDQMDWNVTTVGDVTIGLPNNTQLDAALSGTPATEPHRVAIRFQVTLN